MKIMIGVKYKISELKWKESQEQEPDMLDSDFLDYVRRSCYDRLLVWYSRHFFFKVYAIGLLIEAIIFFLWQDYLGSYVLGFLSLVSIVCSYYYFNHWRNNYCLVDTICAFAAKMMAEKRKKFTTETTKDKAALQSE